MRYLFGFSVSEDEFPHQLLDSLVWIGPQRHAAELLQGVGVDVGLGSPHLGAGVDGHEGRRYGDLKIWRGR
jgi:hypothetical protein